MELASLRAAMLSDRPVVCLYVNGGITDPEVVRRIDSMLHDPQDCSSCFHDEMKVMGDDITFEKVIERSTEVYLAMSHQGCHGIVGVRNKHVFALCVEPRRRGERIGAMLMDEVIRRHPNCALTVFRGDASTTSRLIKYYERLGFVRSSTGTSRHYIAMRHKHR